MATLDDKLLGEKLHYYCSSSEDEGPRGDDEDGAEECRRQRKKPMESSEDRTAARRGLSSSYDLRHSSNTGPKGVLRDYQLQKQAEAQQRELNATGKRAKDPTVDIPLVDIDAELSAAADQALQQILDDRHVHAVSQQHVSARQFGSLISLKNGEDMLKAIDKEAAHVTVIILIHQGQFYGGEPFLYGLKHVSQAFSTIKCCEIAADLLGDSLTADFRRRALPTLQVYRQGILTGNFLRIGDDCKCVENGANSVAEVEDFLNEKGVLDLHEQNLPARE